MVFSPRMGEIYTPVVQKCVRFLFLVLPVAYSLGPRSSRKILSITNRFLYMRIQPVQLGLSLHADSITCAL